MFMFINDDQLRQKENLNMRMIASDLFGLDFLRWPTSSFESLKQDDLRVTCNDSQMKINVDLPGVKKENIEVTFEGDEMNIFSKRFDFDSKKTHRIHVSAIWDRDTTVAAISDGILTITLQKRISAKSHKILVK